MTAPRPDFIQSPTVPQIESVYTLIRFGRKIVSQGNTFTPEDAVEFRRLMNRTSTAFDLPFANDDETPAQLAVNEALNRGDAAPAPARCEGISHD